MLDYGYAIWGDQGNATYGRLMNELQLLQNKAVKFTQDLLFKRGINRTLLTNFKHCFTAVSSFSNMWMVS